MVQAAFVPWSRKLAPIRTFGLKPKESLGSRTPGHGL